MAPAAPAPFTADQQRFGSPEGLNPFASTVGPPAGYGAPPPGASPYGPPPAWGPPPEAPPAAPPAWQPPPAAAPAPPPAGHAPIKDPSAYAATAPPPTSDEFDRMKAAAGSPFGAPPQAPPAYAPPPAYAAPPAYAPAPAPVAPPAPQPIGNAPSAPPPGVAPVAAVSNDPSLRVLAGFLVSYESTELGVFWPIYQGQNLVGRKGAAPGLDVEIDHPTTSSRHAIIHATARPGKLKVEDPGSTNGTFLSDQMIEKNKQQELRDGDALRFGGFNVVVKVI